jgi:hypothetical protein
MNLVAKLKTVASGEARWSGLDYLVNEIDVAGKNDGLCARFPLMDKKSLQGQKQHFPHDREFQINC